MLRILRAPAIKTAARCEFSAIDTGLPQVAISDQLMEMICPLAVVASRVCGREQA